MPVESKTFFGIIALGVIGVSSFGFWNYFSSKKCDKSDEKEPVNKSQTKVKSDENQVKDAEILSPESVSGSKKVDSNNETKKVDSNKKPALIPASKPPPQTISYASAAAKNTPPSPVKASPVSVVVMPPALQLDEKTLDPIHPSEKYLDAIHPSEGNVSSFLFKGADGQTHSVYTLLPNFEIPFTTLHHSSLKSNYHHDDDEEGENKEKESLQKKKLDPKVKQNGGIAPQGQQNGHHVDEPMDKSEKETKHTEKTQTESITIYTDVSHESCTETTTDCAESEVTEILVDSENVDDAKALLSIENVSENLLAPVENNQTNISLDSSSAENDEIIIAENSQLNVQVESNDTPQPYVIQEEKVEPVQEVEQSNQQPPAKKSSFNVAAYEFVPSYQYYQAPYTASDYYDPSVYHQYYDENGYPAYYQQPQPSTTEQQQVKQKHKPRKSHKKKTFSKQHPATTLASFIPTTQSGGSNSANNASSRNRTKSSSVCIYGLTCANKECIYTHE